MRVFVTGGNGFIGSVVVRKLIERGIWVRCLLRPTSDTKRINGLYFDRALGDVRDAASVLAGMKGCDGVIHLASLSNWNDIESPLMHDVVVKGSQHVLEAAKANGNLKMVFVSSVAAINGTKEPIILDENSPCTLDPNRYAYSKAKVAAENLCRQAISNGQPVVIVNPAEVYGPHDTSLNTAGNLLDFAKSSPVLVCRGGTSVVYVDDVAEGIIAALQKGRSGERYILGGENLSVTELAKLTLDILGQKDKKIIEIPNWLLSFAARVADRFHIPFPINPKVVPYATLFWFMDNRKAVDELGLSFRTARETLEPTLKWLKDKGYLKA